ncbi:MAG: HNH endonuclease [Azospirillum sp.]|nr:HNH endonuclease [Azospirillum sp.]
MPSAPPRACRCGTLVPAGKPCPRCSRERDLARGSRQQRGYDADWQRFRAAFLRQHPICSTPDCGAPATDVDHIKALRDRGARLDPANCRPFCHPCHSRRTGRDQVPHPPRG